MERWHVEFEAGPKQAYKFMKDTLYSAMVKEALNDTFLEGVYKNFEQM